MSSEARSTRGGCSLHKAAHLTGIGLRGELAFPRRTRDAPLMRRRIGDLKNLGTGRGHSGEIVAGENDPVFHFGRHRPKVEVFQIEEPHVEMSLNEEKWGYNCITDANQMCEERKLLRYRVVSSFLIPGTIICLGYVPCRELTLSAV
ncbi:hypothetical protein HYDPIDRAFT_109993 [Hydnomerulius pinastri MD-312]|nr:hypothetical protein HYDPIDRAFT_109993 [Hydnomerulius pinastri MD-312]